MELCARDSFNNKTSLDNLNKKSIISKIFENFAFSLIELSIILVIIGLLVGGITGGVALVENAKVRSLMSEIRGWQQAVLVFVTRNDRLPGDLNYLNRIGLNSGQVYDANSFGAPYDGSTYAIPSEYSAPFIDLYLSGITEFQPTNTDNKYVHVSCAVSKVVPTLNSYKGMAAYFEHTSFGSLAGGRGSQLLTVFSFGDNLDRVDPEVFKKIYEKLDDGVKTTGNLVSNCSSGSASENYDYFIKNKLKCSYFYYVLDSLKS